VAVTDATVGRGDVTHGPGELEIQAPPAVTQSITTRAFLEEATPAVKV
jgi:hypothetical protein